MREVILADFGGVLARHHCEPAETELARAVGTDRESVRRLLSEKTPHGRDVRRATITLEEFWDKVFKLAGRTSASRPSDEELTRMWAATYEFDERLSGTLDALRVGRSIGVVTNVDAGRSPYVERSAREHGCLDHFFPSWRHGADKSEAIFWKSVRLELESRGETGPVTYIDDRVEHLELARATVGWNTVLYRDPEDLTDLTRRMNQ